MVAPNNPYPVSVMLQIDSDHVAVSGAIPPRALQDGRLILWCTMHSAEILTEQYDSGKLVVVDQIEDERVETYAVGDGGEIASYGYADGESMTQEQARVAGREYGLGYIAGREK